MINGLALDSELGNLALLIFIIMGMIYSAKWWWLHNLSPTSERIIRNIALMWLAVGAGALWWAIAFHGVGNPPLTSFYHQLNGIMRVAVAAIFGYAVVDYLDVFEEWHGWRVKFMHFIGAFILSWFITLSVW